MKTWIKPVAVGVLLLGCAFGVGSCVATRPYSEGHRDGFVQKFSRKGILRKSYEGDLALAGSARSQAVGNVWHFTVSDPDVVKSIENVNAGQLVRLHYDEYLWTVGGETNYRITKVELLKE